MAAQPLSLRSERRYVAQRDDLDGGRQAKLQCWSGSGTSYISLSYLLPSADTRYNRDAIMLDYRDSGMLIAFSHTRSILGSPKRAHAATAVKFCLLTLSSTRSFTTSRHRRSFPAAHYRINLKRCRAGFHSSQPLNRHIVLFILTLLDSSGSCVCRKRSFGMPRFLENDALGHAAAPSSDLLRHRVSEHRKTPRCNDDGPGWWQILSEGGAGKHLVRISCFFAVFELAPCNVASVRPDKIIHPT
ncbi:hypothetical protein PHSY_006566 [Pseudozyma hubeiensis SY62]|uniref:Uncharacterized protein n=1 Tax=Pseudozyma hubeiensis (strain SY62) TaxID=1305764 RepID=R9PC91_PSEHS|nr:hypothetical protein PHSY_006566 [Pseudozyma hubeiensis SY62]GAC98969.1 hypothetical protein PHSY_006566 [Pseudozyma hubeiensis SY62]